MRGHWPQVAARGLLVVAVAGALDALTTGDRARALAWTVFAVGALLNERTR